MTVLRVDLPFPPALAAESRAAIEAGLSRLNRAEDAEDRPQIVGCAKDLAEAVAKSIIAASGDTAGGSAGFPALIHQAHRALQRQPGPGLSSAPGVGEIAQGAKTLVTALGSVRNTHGAGHGRAFEFDVEDEMLDLVVPAALLWSRWALRRLGQLLAGELQPLIDQVTGPGTFGRGDLAARLQAADLPRIAPVDQRRLGLAVARRALSGTFMVRIDGVEACAADDSIIRWPPAYREGLAQGLFVDRDGYLAPEPWSVEAAARVLAPIPGPLEAVVDLLALLEQSPLLPNLAANASRRAELIVALSESARLLPPGQQGPWLSSVDRLRQDD